MEKTFPLRPLSEDAPGTINLPRVMDLEAWRADVRGHPGLLIKMPVPEGPGCAFFVGIVLLVSADSPQTWTTDLRARLFTLERMLHLEGDEAIKSGRFCEWVSDAGTLKHRNSGLEVPATSAAFLDAVASALQHGDQIPATVSMQSSSGSSGPRITLFTPPAPQLPQPETKKRRWKFW